MKISQRTPRFRIEFYRWPGDTRIAELSSNQVLRFSYSEQLGSMSAPWAVSMNPAISYEGKPLYTLLRAPDIVVFSQYRDGAFRQSFVGIIEDTDAELNYGEKPDFDFTVTGRAVTSIFDYPMNLSIEKIGLSAGITALDVSNQLKKFSVENPRKTDLRDFFKYIVDSWLRLFDAMCGPKHGESEVRQVFDKYIDIETVAGNQIVRNVFPQKLSAPNTQTSLSQMLQWVSNFPLVLSYCAFNSDTKKYQLYLDYRPLAPRKWKDLTLAERISDLYIVGHNIHNSSKDAITVVRVTIPEAFGGTSIAQAYAAGIADLKVETVKGITINTQGPVMASIPDSVQKFGYKPYELQLRFVDQGKTDDIWHDVKEARDDLINTFKNNHLFMSGKVTIQNDYVERHIGQRVVVDTFGDGCVETGDPNGGERSAMFYIEGITTTGGYGQSDEVSYDLTRGAIYDREGEFKAPLYLSGDNASLRRTN